MVRKVVEIANLMDREVATPKEARQILGLKKENNSPQRTQRGRAAIKESA
jgi:hypothetical protein